MEKRRKGGDKLEVIWQLVEGVGGNRVSNVGSNCESNFLVLVGARE